MNRAVDTGGLEVADVSTPRDVSASDAADASDGADAFEAGSPMCVGPFRSLTREQLGALTAATSRCSSSRDLDITCTVDLELRQRACTAACLSGGVAPGTVLNCVHACVQAGELSADCADCYRDRAACSVTKCPACLSAPDGEACSTCQSAANCTGAFYACSGLPLLPPADSGVPRD